MHVQTLVALDWDNADLSIDRVLAFVGDALVDHTVSTVAHWKTGVDQTEHRVRFDSRRVRNTEVNGVGYHAGFVVHIA